MILKKLFRIRCCQTFQKLSGIRCSQTFQKLCRIRCSQTFKKLSRIRSVRHSEKLSMIRCSDIPKTVQDDTNPSSRHCVLWGFFCQSWQILITRVCRYVFHFKFFSFHVAQVWAGQPVNDSRSWEWSASLICSSFLARGLRRSLESPWQPPFINCHSVLITAQLSPTVGLRCVCVCGSSFV